MKRNNVVTVHVRMPRRAYLALQALCVDYRLDPEEAIREHTATLITQDVECWASLVQECNDGRRTGLSGSMTRAVEEATATA